MKEMQGNLSLEVKVHLNKRKKTKEVNLINAQIKKGFKLMLMIAVEVLKDGNNFNSLMKYQVIHKILHFISKSNSVMQEDTDSM